MQAEYDCGVKITKKAKILSRYCPLPKIAPGGGIRRCGPFPHDFSNLVSGFSHF